MEEDLEQLIKFVFFNMPAPSEFSLEDALLKEVE